ncbi:kelch repeat-containing protein [Bdellovibrio sp. BCCA]|uniref:kelch repeat-containing protein n=1 Tax=Bdellovibrio sp. BCCA TaxID=3136281 RepID=UPI0030F19B55
MRRTVLWAFFLLISPLLSGCSLDLAIDSMNPTDLLESPSLDNTLNSSKLIRAQYPQTVRVLNTATTLQNGKILLAGGALNATNSTVALSSAEIYDPETGSWSQAASLPQERLNHTATALQDGKVLIVGGAINNSVSTTCLNTAALYDPTSNTWSAAASLVTGRCYHSATLLSDGRVMVIGGRTENSLALGISNYLSTAEIYNPATNTWTAAASMTTNRGYHSAILLKNGKVFVVGGRNTSGLLTTALYNPSANSWAAGPSLTKSRKDHTATLLPEGKVVIIGGVDDAGVILSDTTIYDPSSGPSGTFSNGAALAVARKSHTATLVGDRVFVIGGSTTSTVFKDTVIYDPSTNQWQTFADLQSGPRYLHTANIAGNYLVVLGGLSETTYLFPANTPERLNISTFIWKSEGNMSASRFIPAAALLNNGKVFISGGVSTEPTLTYPTSSDIFDPATGNWKAAAPIPASRARSTATTLPNGKVLVVGGQDDANILGTTVLYDPDSDSWSAGPSLTHPRSGHVATLLPNGKVLVIGGTGDFAGSVLIGEAEVYDPSTNTWSSGGTMPVPCFYPSATMVSGGQGKVFVIGGLATPVYSQAVQIYDVASNTWTSGASLTTGRMGHIAAAIGGKILVAGGGTNTGGFLNSVEIYDIASNTWQPGPAMSMGRNSAGAATLPDGKILVIGGQVTNLFATSSSEIYDPVANSWSKASRFLNTGRGGFSLFTLPDRILVLGGADPMKSIITAESYGQETSPPQWQAPDLLKGRTNHTSTLLKDGRVLVAGGSDGVKPISSTAIYNPSTNQWTAGPNLSVARQNHTATLLSSGKVFIAAGSGGGAGLDFNQTADIFDPSTNTITTMPILTARAVHAAIEIPGGKVLLSGGVGSTDISTKNEICDPNAGTCQASADRPNGLYDVVVPLKNGDYLFVGAFGNSTYHPATDSWTAVASMSVQRAFHAALLLPNGKVLVVGGISVLDGQTVASMEIYDSTTNTWSAGAPLDTPLSLSAINLLPSGEVVLTGGTASSIFEAGSGVRIYNYLTNQWTLAQPLKDARVGHTATLLKNGHLMVYGGQSPTLGTIPFWEQVFDP